MNKTRKQVAKELGIHPETLTKLLNAIGIKKREAISQDKVNEITNHLYFKITRKKLAERYRVHPDTMTSVLHGAGIFHARKLSIFDLKTFYNKIGLPLNIDDKSINTSQKQAEIKPLRIERKGKSIEISPSKKIQTRKELSKQLDIHPETLAKFLVKLKIPKREALWPGQVEKILWMCNPLFFKMTRANLARRYGLHPETLAKKIRTLGIIHNKKLSIDELCRIYKALGIPNSLFIEFPEQSQFVTRNYLE